MPDDTNAALRDMMRTIGGLESTVKTLVDTWRSQEQSAASSRRVLYEKFERLEGEVLAFGDKLTGAIGDIAIMKPIVSEVERAKQRAIGAGLMGRALWLLAGTMISGGLWLLAQIKH